MHGYHRQPGKSTLLSCSLSCFWPSLSKISKILIRHLVVLVPARKPSQKSYDLLFSYFGWIYCCPLSLLVSMHFDPFQRLAFPCLPNCVPSRATSTRRLAALDELLFPSSSPRCHRQVLRPMVSPCLLEMFYNRYSDISASHPHQVPF